VYVDVDVDIRETRSLKRLSEADRGEEEVVEVVED